MVALLKFDMGIVEIVIVQANRVNIRLNSKLLLANLSFPPLLLPCTCQATDLMGHPGVWRTGVISTISLKNWILGHYNQDFLLGYWPKDSLKTGFFAKMPLFNQLHDLKL